MSDNNNFEIIIIGGSYSGLSAAMSLGRALRNVLIIDSERPRNKQTPYSHNFLTQDGKTPMQIATLAKEQVSQYKTVKFYSGLAVRGAQTEGFAECWGISVIHCPYCHGYEVKNEKTGILGNGDYGFEFSRLVNSWTKNLTLYTNGKSTLTTEQTEKLRKHNISVVENRIDCFEQINGKIQNIVFNDNSKTSIIAIYARPELVQHSEIPAQLGCELTEQGIVKVDASQKTTIQGVFACGDNSNSSRDIALAVSTGMVAGGTCNKEIIQEEF